MVTLDAIMTGTISAYGPSGQRSAIRKRPVEGPVRIDPTGIVGDEHAYHAHGGPDKAALHYAFDHHGKWAKLFPEAADRFASPGLFGENFTSTGMTERDVCIGDRYRIGGALLEVTGPRQPCGKLAYRVSIPEVPERMQQDATTGWFYRCIEPGLIEAGQQIELVDRVLPEWSVARVILGLYGTPLDEAFLRPASELIPLAQEIRNVLLTRLETGKVEDWSGRMAMLT